MMIEDFLIYAPPIIMLFIYTVIFRLKGNKWRAIHVSVQSSALFYMIAVLLLIQQHFDLNLLGYTLIFMIVILTFILIKQWKNETEVLLNRAFKMLWRALFVLFFIAYIGLQLYVLIRYLITIYAG